MNANQTHPQNQTLLKNAVVITPAPPGDYRQDFVALPKAYGTPAYENRPDIQAIRQVVDENLTRLDAHTGFIRRMEGKTVILKPNLVTVYSRMGLVERDYPETTDPRVLDALVLFLKRYAPQIVIAESSGRGVPTRGSFRVAGLDRLAKHRQVALIALEEQPTSRYYLPGASVQKEIIIPTVFESVLRGEAFFISVPKMKTNLYTEVTLGFKNAMGLLPYNLRQRHHHFALDEKLVDILRLIQPDLTVIDGLVGGEGNCPAPVDPVDSRVIISGTNCLETDRVAARMMGFDPDRVRLFQAADAGGFGDPATLVEGDQTVTPYRPADPSLFSLAFQSQFPNVLALIGHSLPHAIQLEPQARYAPHQAERMAMACRGGCLASTRFGFEMIYREGLPQDFNLVVIIGNGAQVDGQRIYLDASGTPYTMADIAALPGKKLAVGSCTQGLATIVDRHIDGCMPFPNQPHVALHRLTGTYCRVVSLKNRHLLPLLVDTVRACEQRKRLYRAGIRLDCELSRAYGPPDTQPPIPTEAEQDIIPWALPPLEPDEIKALCASENRAMLATFLG
ncbi:MAG: DUF362 domain-containing protein [Brevefilum sp.]